jgi:hypothetical protein
MEQDGRPFSAGSLAARNILGAIMKVHSVVIDRFRTGRQYGSWLLAATLLLLFAPAGSSAQSNASPAGRVISHTPVQVLDGRATLTNAYDPTRMLRLSIALTPPHMDQQRQLIDQLHDKKSPLFHKWLTPEQWNARFAPSVEDEQAVVDWAKGQGLTITNRFPNRLLVDVEAPVGTIEKAFGITINNYTMNGQTYFANDHDPVLPNALLNTVQGVIGLNSFLQLRPAISHGRNVPVPDYTPGPAVALAPAQQSNGNKQKLDAALAVSRSKAAATGKPQITNGYYDPSDIYSDQAYNFNGLYNQGHCCNPNSNPDVSPPETTIAIAAFGDLNYTDLAGFKAQYPYLAYNVQKRYIDGTYTCNNSPNIDDNCLEVTLDTEYSLAMSNSFGSYVNTSKIWVYEGASYGDIADVYNQMITDGYAKVTSTSWGCEEYACFDGSTMSSLDSIFTSMVGQGWTLIAASGDQGSTAGCTDAVAVQFPSSDPNFVGAGGTTLEMFDGPVFDSEVGWTGDTYSGACSKNAGGSTGGFSSYFGEPSYQSSFGYSSRAVPDISLNANVGQNMYFGPAGGLIGVGGTSIVAPELAGFFAQQNAYGLSIGNACNGSGGACAPIGNANYALYAEGVNQNASHYPYYDITSGCNSNDITAEFDLGYYCAGTGYDEVTGWGAANMLQLSWALNWETAITAAGPSISFGGPTVNTWYNSDQIVDWDVDDNVDDGGSPTGIAGYTQGWDSIPSDSYFLARPATGDSFFVGPQHVNSSFGCTDLNGSLCTGGPVSQGCHTVYVQGWNNMGVPSGIQSYGPICYDTTPPTAGISITGTKNGSVYISGVKIVLTASDPGSGSGTGSGVAGIYWQINGGTLTKYTAPIGFSTTGANTISYYSVDVAGNQSAVGTASFPIESPTTTALTSSATTANQGENVTFTATITKSFGNPPLGSVTFRNGSTVLATVTVAGSKGVYTTKTLPVGTDSITAEYDGSSYDEASTSPAVTETIKSTTQSTTTAVTSSLNPSAYQQLVKFTATVTAATSGIPTGTVTFKDNSTVLATLTLEDGKATYDTTALPVGIAHITAVYNGSTTYSGSTSALFSQTISKAKTSTALTSSLNPSTSGRAVTFSAVVTSVTGGTPTGTVTFKNGPTALATVTLSAGKATYTTTGIPVGTHSITADYNGDSNYATNDSPILSQVVNP